MMLNPVAEEEYLALVRAFPLLSIRDDAHLAAALAVADKLLEQPTRSVAEEAYLSALTDLVEVYEAVVIVIPPVSGIAALRYLMEENGLRQHDLAHLFGAPSIISAVLAGKRRLALAHMERLAEHFGLPITVFIESGAHAS
ncbi:MAG: helix-turn-helix domain-containing protein [Chloroflexota bacterium]|nr:helix-turn-helix domain-containing protein [Chloroflexota bacterium]